MPHSPDPQSAIRIPHSPDPQSAIRIPHSAFKGCELSGGNAFAGTTQEVREVAQALAVSEAKEGSLVDDGPVLAVLAEDVVLRVARGFAGRARGGTVCW